MAWRLYTHTRKTPHLPSYKRTLLHYLQFSGKRSYRKRLTLCAILKRPPFSQIVNWEEGGRMGILSYIRANWVNGIGSLSKYSCWMVQNSIPFKIMIRNWERVITAGNLTTATRWFKYDQDWFVCKQAALRSSCATLREWSHNLHPPSCSS